MKNKTIWLSSSNGVKEFSEKQAEKILSYEKSGWKKATKKEINQAKKEAGDDNGNKAEDTSE